MSRFLSVPLADSGDFVTDYGSQLANVGRAKDSSLPDSVMTVASDANGSHNVGEEKWDAWKRFEAWPTAAHLSERAGLSNFSGGQCDESVLSRPATSQCRPGEANCHETANEGDP